MKSFVDAFLCILLVVKLASRVGSPKAKAVKNRSLLHQAFSKLLSFPYMIMVKTDRKLWVYDRRDLTASNIDCSDESMNEVMK